MPEMDEMEAAAEAEGGEDEKKGKKKKFPLKLIIILVVGLGVLGGGGFFAYKYFLAGDEEPAAEAPKKEEAAKGEEAKKEEKAPEKPGALLEMEPFIVNLADPSGKRYLKLKLAVDAKDEKIKQELEARMPQIRDSILLLLTSKSYADIAPVAGKIRLRNEILKIINRALIGVGSVHAVYFSEFVVQ